MAVTRRASEVQSVDWHITNHADDPKQFWNLTHEDKVVVLLTGIREELRTLNRLLACANFQRLPRDVRRIDRRLATRLLLSGETPKRKKAATR